MRVNQVVKAARDMTRKRLRSAKSRPRFENVGIPKDTPGVVLDPGNAKKGVRVQFALSDGSTVKSWFFPADLLE